MKVDYVKIDDVNGEITVTLEEQDYADKVKKQLKEIGKNHAEPGFRPGKVPAGLIQKKYGSAVKYDIINKEVGNAVFDYIKENKLHVLGNPVPQQGNDFDIEAKDFTLKFKVGIAPEFETKVNKDLSVPYYTIKVSEDMINKQDELLTRRFGKQEPGEEVDATALVKGVITELDENGQPQEGGVVVENAIVAPQYFKSEEQRNLFLGKKVGDVVKFNPAATCDSNPTEMSSMLNIDKSEVEAHKGDFNFDIKEIIVLKPAEHNQEYFDMVFGADKVHNEEEYFAELKKIIEAGLSNDSDYRFTIDARKAIQDAIGTLQLPAEILKDFLKNQNEALNDENIDEEYTRLIPELEWELEKEAIASQLDIKIEEEDLLNTARQIAQTQFAQYGMNSVPAETLDRYASDILKDQKARTQIYNQTVDNKLFNGIRASVTLDNKEVNVEEFNDLFRNA
ncbi:MAG: trigger factor [Muribaculaceae bacterium]|nr:trigger factor [Muribaculaceae bacterium]